MTLSIVIISYNVKFFLEQCLASIQKALAAAGLQADNAEVIIIDNASVDDSVGFLAPLFPAFRFIGNLENTGFSRANNQALHLCTGEWILFLNPDTILAEDCLDICLAFMRSTPDAGALGVHMIDGSGRYLKESKRGFPSPRTSFFKMTGLARIFPASGLVAAYYMGNLDEHATHVVDILSGAFMMVRKNVLDKTGGFDEQFFMYGEDIDLSYRISLAGFRNYYLPAARIVHFKGESTHKDVRYVNMFYSAMDLFAKKHIQGSGSVLQSFFLKTGIRFYKSLASLRTGARHVKRVAARLVFIQGTEEKRQQWKKMLAARKIPVTDTRSLAGEIIFCEGPQLSWKSVIIEISRVPGRSHYKFHGTGTHAAVGAGAGLDPGSIYEI